MKLQSACLVACVLIACGDDDDDRPDGGQGFDASSVADATSNDASPGDAESRDANMTGDATSFDATGGDAEPSDGGTGPCPIQGNTRLLLEEVINETFMSSAHVAEFSHPMERGFALQLPGVDEGYLGFLTLFEECRGPSAYDPYCEYAGLPPGEPVEPFWMTRDKCLQLGCIGDSLAFVDVWMTVRPITSSTVAHAFTYETTAPMGSAIYDPNPHVLYLVDLRTPMVTTVTATLSATATVTPTAEAPIDLSYRGSVEVSIAQNGFGTFDLALSFPRLVAEGGVDVTLNLVDHMGGGSILVAGAPVAAITTTPNVPVIFDWSTCP